MFLRISKDRMCPNCKGLDSYRVRRKGVSVKMMCSLLNVRPHYCPDCDKLFLVPKRAKEIHVREALRGTVGNPHPGGGHVEARTPLPH